MAAACSAGQGRRRLRARPGRTPEQSRRAGLGPSTWPSTLGSVPALVDSDLPRDGYGGGDQLHIADRFADAQLSPAVRNSPKHAKVPRYLMTSRTQFQSGPMHFLYPERSRRPSHRGGDPASAEAEMARRALRLARLQARGVTTWLVGDKRTVSNIYLFMLRPLGPPISHREPRAAQHRRHFPGAGGAAQRGPDAR